MSGALEETPLPSDARQAPPVEGVPRPSPGTRLLFVWFLIWAVLLTVPFSVCLVVGHWFDPSARNFKRWAGRWGRAILGGIGVRTRLTARAPLPAEQPYVFVSNHQNLLDIPALAAALPHPFGFVAKAELARIPFLGFAIRHSASLYVDRSTPRRSVASLKEAGARIRAGNSVLIFPEGARSFAPVLYPFKRGAFFLALEAGVPVVPVTLVDAYRRMDERHYAARPGLVHIVVGRPIPTEGLSRRDVPQLMEAVRAQIEAEL